MAGSESFPQYWILLSITRCAFYHITRWTECTTAPCIMILIVYEIKLHSLTLPTRHGLNPLEVDRHGARSQGRTAVATHRTSLVPPSDPNRAVKEGRLHGHMPNPIPHAHSPTPTPPPYTVPHTGPPLYTRPPHAAQQCSVHGLGPADSSREGWRTLPYTLALYPTECDTLSCACEFVCARATWCHVLVWT